MNRLSIVTVLLTTLVAANAQATDSQPASANAVDQFKETVTVCTNLDMYPAIAMRNRDAGMPLDTARDLIVVSMQKNLKDKLLPGMLEPYIEVAKDIYGRVYADSKLGPESISDIVFETCSGFRGYSIDKTALKTELSGYVPSAFDRFSRVPVCVKAGQSAANIARGRDGGMTKERIAEVATDALQNDPATLALAPTIIEEVYSLEDLELTSFYAYNVRRCVAKKAGASLPSLASLEPQVEQCEQLTSKEDKTTCLESTFKPKDGT